MYCVRLPGLSVRRGGFALWLPSVIALGDYLSPAAFSDRSRYGETKEESELAWKEASVHHGIRVAHEQPAYQGPTVEAHTSQTGTKSALFTRTGRDARGGR